MASESPSHIISSHLFGQTSTDAALSSVANFSVADPHSMERQILALSAQAYGLRNNNSLYAKKYSAEALALAEEAAFGQGIAEATFVSGVVHACAAEQDIALRDLARAGEQFRVLGGRIGLEGNCRVARWMGIVYRNIGMAVTALEYFNQSHHLALEANNQAFISYALMNIGDSYMLLDEAEKAMEFHQRALIVAQTTTDTDLQAQVLWSFARNSELQQRLEEAYHYYHQSYNIRRSNGDVLGMGTARYGMAMIVEKQGNRAKALRIYLELWTNFKSGISGVPQTEAFITKEIGRMYAESGKPHRALPYLERSMEIAQKVGVPTIIASANEAFAKFYKATGEYEKALSYFEEFHRINAEIAQLESKQTIQYFRQAFDFERAQKETEIYRLRNEELASAYAQNERLLLNVLPEAIALRIKAGETTIAEHFNDVTVMFADIVGFTELSARRKPEEVVDLLNRIFSVFDIFSEQYNLEKIKTIGDAYMIVGGVPNPCDDHAESVARMALEMQETIHLLARSMKLELAIRIGIHSGAVVAGVIGQKKFSYDLWGDTVNIASRMESHGEPGKIHCSAIVAERLAGKFSFEARTPLDIKGKGLMNTYFLIGKL